MARVNVDILGISKLKWTRMSEFNSDDHYIYNWESIPKKKWSRLHSQQKILKCSTWMQSQKRQNDLCSSPRQTIQYHIYPSLCPTSNVEEAEVERFYEDLQDILELIPKKRCPFHHRGLECKSKKSRNIWSNRQIWPWNAE